MRASTLVPLAAALALAFAEPGPARASGAIAPGAVAPNFTKTALGGGPVSLSSYSGKVVVLFLFGYDCPFCLADGPSVQQNIQQHYATRNPGEVQVLGVDLWNGTPAQVTGFRNATGATFPLLQLGATATGGNVDLLYGPFDNHIVINKQGIVRYHAALTHAHGNRYHLDEIRGTVDSLVAPTVGVEDALPPAPALVVGPNPARGPVSIAFANPGGSSVAAEVVILDLAGRRVATPFSGPAGAGWTRLAWDGRRDDGAPAGAGLYFARATIGGRTRVARLSLLR